MAKKRLIVYMDDKEVQYLSNISFIMNWTLSETARQAIIHSFPWLNEQAHAMEKRVLKKNEF